MIEEKDVLEYFDSLKSVYKISFDLKSEQLKVLLATLNQQNAFAVLPTGYGKTMCFALIPLLLDEVNTFLCFI